MELSGKYEGNSYVLWNLGCQRTFIGVRREFQKRTAGPSLMHSDSSRHVLRELTWHIIKVPWICGRSFNDVKREVQKPLKGVLEMCGGSVSDVCKFQSRIAGVPEV